MGLTTVAESPGPARCSRDVWGAGVALGLDASSYEQKELECGAQTRKALGPGSWEWAVSPGVVSSP